MKNISKNITKSSKGQLGFTIVELLVVIVIIGILAAVTIVAYTGVTNRANESTNKATANQILNAANAIYTVSESEPKAFPATAATTDAVLSNLKTDVATVKLPNTESVLTSGAKPEKNNEFSYRTVVTDDKATGVCVGYWDPLQAKAVYLFAGDAKSDNGTTCSTS